MVARTTPQFPFPIERIDITFGTDIHVPLRMIFNNFCDPQSFHLMPSGSNGQFVQHFGLQPNTFLN